MLETTWLTNGAFASTTSDVRGPGSGLVAAGLALIVFLVIVGVVIKAVDLKRKRTADTTHLRAVISDALHREPGLFGLALTPTVRLPFWRGTPATIAVSGTVPTQEQREVVLRVVKAEACRIRPDVDVDNQLVIFRGSRAAS